MADKSFILDLAKLVIAAAWADGELTNEEINALKDLLFLLPDLSGEDWLGLELYMDSPVGPEERHRLLRAVVEGIRTAEEKALVIDTLTKVIEADGEVEQEEAEALAQVKRDVEGAPTGLLSHLTKVIRGAVGKRRARSGSGPNRDERLDDFIKNRIYFHVVSELEERGLRLDIPDPQIRKLCLAAGLMARVAWTDAEVSDQEKETIKRVLVEEWGLSTEEARLVKEISVANLMQGLDGVRLTRNFFERTGHDERRAFVRCLFRVANAAHKTSFEEINAIQSIAKGLKLSHREFIEAKLTIPREDRRGL